MARDRRTRGTPGLNGRRVLITGPARGLGWELAQVLAERGARLSLVGLEPQLLSERASYLGAGHVWFGADVTDQASIDRAVAETVATLGGIDAVVTNAGIANVGTLASGPVDAHVRTMDVNVNGTIRTLSATLPHLLDSHGYALLIASVGSFGVFPGLSTYGASKAAVEHLANGLRLELAHRGVQVGSAHPAFVDTDLVRDSDASSAAMRSARRRLSGPLGKTYPPRMCAEALANGIARKSRRVYVPRSLVLMQVLRSLVLSSAGDSFMNRQLNLSDFIPALEAEVAARNRPFGANSAESQAAALVSKRKAKQQ